MEASSRCRIREVRGQQADVGSHERARARRVRDQRYRRSGAPRSSDDGPGGCRTGAGALLRAAGVRGVWGLFFWKGCRIQRQRVAQALRGSAGRGLKGPGSLCDRDSFTCKMRRRIPDLPAPQGWCFESVNRRCMKVQVNTSRWRREGIS